MRVLSIGSDPSLLTEGSASWQRQLAYAHAFGALDIVNVVSQRGTYAGEGLSIRAASHLNAYRLARALPKPDVVTAQDPFELGLIAWRAARHFEVPLHVQLHTDPFDPDFKRAHWPLNWIRLLLMGFVLRRATRIRVVSERVKRSLGSHYRLSAPVSVLPIFIDVAAFKGARPPVELVERFAAFPTKLLVVSRLEQEKNVSLAITAFAESAPQGACLIIVGEGTQRAVLERLAKKLGVGDRVFFEGQSDARPYYALCDLLLVPSKYEGYGMTIVEALAAGKPVISTDVGIARDAGAIVSDEASFAAALAAWYAQGPRSASLRLAVRDPADAITAVASDIMMTSPNV
jgi:glycosyltransferase involved in cell wall biosynthesis